MKKRLLCAMLAMIMLFSLLPAGAPADATLAPHTHPLCGASCGSHSDGSSHDNVVWTASDGMPASAGNWYLTQDVTLSPSTDASGWTAPAGVTNLCLNGHTITTPANGTNSAISVITGITLNICDCSTTTRCGYRGTDGTYTVGDSIPAEGAMEAGTTYDTLTQSDLYAVAPDNTLYRVRSNSKTITLLASSTYTMTYDRNGATGGEAPKDNKTYEYYDRVTVLDNTGGLVRTGYTFDGWNLAADGSEQVLRYYQDFYITQSLTLYANWKLIKPTVTLAADKTTPVNYGEKVTLTATVETVAPGATYSYTWYRNGSQVSTTTANKLTLENAPESGSYTVTATASYGNQNPTSDASNAVSVTINRIQHAKPAAPALASKAYSSISVTAVNGQKYICLPATAAAPTSSTAGWNTNGRFTGLTPNTAYRIYTYVDADANHTASEVSAALEVTTAQEKVTDVTPPKAVTLTDYYTEGAAAAAALA